MLRYSNFSLIIILVLILGGGNCLSQQYSIGIQTGMQWHSPDFYLNYKAEPNPALKVTYDDGTKSNVVETYEFYSVGSGTFRLYEEVRNPLKKGRAKVYSIGLGYSTTGFTITSPKSVFLNDTSILRRSSIGIQDHYRLGYLNIPLGVKKVFWNTTETVFFSVDLEVNNFFLVSREVHYTIYGGLTRKAPYTGRITAARKYYLSAFAFPEVGFSLGDKWLLTFQARVGLTPLNLLKPGNFENDLSPEERKAGVYQQTRIPNVFFGGGLSISYLLE